MRHLRAKAQSFATKELVSGQDWVNFRNEIKKAITDVESAWPEYGIEADLEGVTVTKTSPSVEKKPPRLQLD